jgi:hypothetical protein
MTEAGIVQYGVVATRSIHIVENAIFSIWCDADIVRIIGGCRFDSRNQVLVKEKLTDMSDMPSSDGVVGQESGPDVC